MSDPSYRKHVADMVVRRVLSQVDNCEDLAVALKREYPFGDDPQGREIWLDAVLRHTHAYLVEERQKM
jgi:hypothetical protein